MVSILGLVQNSAVSPTASVTPTQNATNPSLATNIRLDQITLGKTLQGQILSITNDGHAQINVTVGYEPGSQIKIPIPSGYSVGDQIAMTLLSNDQGQPQWGVSLVSAQNENLQLSLGAQIISGALHSTYDTSAVIHTTPLLSTTDINPEFLASKLQQALTNSGVFYESHLRQWNDGRRSLDQIRLEPQNNASDPQVATNLIPVQLGVLENKNLMWFGPIWPDQEMEWDVTQDQGKNPSSESKETNEVSRPWLTSIKLNLPHLGPITAHIRLEGDHATLNIRAPEVNTINQLNNESESLSAALAAAGIILDSFSAGS